MASFKVKELNKDKKFVVLDIVFDDGEKYTKRMMVSAFDEETVKTEVEDWLSDYEPVRHAKPEETTDIKLNKSISIQVKPKEK